MILAIYCGGGLGREVLELAYLINDIKHKWDKIIFVDDVIPDDRIQGVEKFSFEELKKLHTPDEIKFVIATGEPQLRKKLFDKVSDNGYGFEKLIHPDVHIPETTEIGVGSIISNNAFISCNVVIEDNVVMQPCSCIGHDSIIKHSSVVSSFTVVCGHCFVGQETFIGINTAIKEKTNIGSYCIIGMASAVFRDIPDSCIAMGNPARILKKNESGRVF